MKEILFCPHLNIYSEEQSLSRPAVLEKKNVETESVRVANSFSDLVDIQSKCNICCTIRAHAVNGCLEPEAVYQYTGGKGEARVSILVLLVRATLRFV